MIIGLAGSFGAGKGEVANYLTRERGFQHLSARSLIIEEVKKRGLNVDRDSLTKTGNDLREEGGPTYLYELLIKKANQIGGDVAVESIRAVAEARYTKENGGVVIGVDADSKLRYERAIKRGSETDQVTFEEWLEQERKESNPGDPTKQDIFGALKESDYLILNNGTMTELHKQIDDVLEQLSK